MHQIIVFDTSGITLRERALIRTINEENGWITVATNFIKIVPTDDDASGSHGDDAPLCFETTKS